MNNWPPSNPVFPYIDWKKEAEMMRRGREERLNNKEAALQLMMAAGIDPKTGMVKAKVKSK